MDLLKNRDYFFYRLYNIIKKRRIEIENTPLYQPLSHDILTSCMTANTPRDANAIKHTTDSDLLRPMTDQEIFGIILDAMLGGLNPVNKFYFYFILFFLYFQSFNVKKKNFSLNYRLCPYFVLLYIILNIILK